MIKRIRDLIVKYNELIVYLVFGVLTTAVNWGIYSVLVKYFSFNINAGNIIAWIVAVVFAFVTNKIWVFKSKTTAFKLVLKEFVLFVGARALSGVIEIGGLPLLVWLGLGQTVFGVEAFLAKIVISFVVIILNFIFSKLIVFKKKKEDNDEL
ncbi:MAG: GtrA family protein [Acutalibacteraceae bacterium]